jgi:hypothetical protein
MPMDYDDMKNYFLATMEQFQSHQEEIARIAISLEAAIVALKKRSPEFALDYEANYAGLERGPGFAESQRLIERIQVAIRGLKESE